MSEGSEQAVIVYLKLSNEEFGECREREAAYGVEDELREALVEAGVGTCDGHEFGGGYTTLFMYGPSADGIADAAVPVVRRHAPAPAHMRSSDTASLGLLRSASRCSARRRARDPETWRPP
jgi:hypothetical protein